jgi:hypothetical protein
MLEATDQKLLGSFVKKIQSLGYESNLSERGEEELGKLLDTPEAKTLKTEIEILISSNQSDASQLKRISDILNSLTGVGNEIDIALLVKEFDSLKSEIEVKNEQRDAEGSVARKPGLSPEDPKKYGEERLLGGR